MTVSELIEELKKYPQEMDIVVYYDGGHYEFEPFMQILDIEGTEKVIIEASC